MYRLKSGKFIVCNGEREPIDIELLKHDETCHDYSYIYMIKIKNKLIMKQWNLKMLIKVVENNGYHFNRYSGSHMIYRNNNGYHISIPRNLKCITAQKLVKKYNLNVTVD